MMLLFIVIINNQIVKLIHSIFHTLKAKKTTYIFLTWIMK